MHGIRLGDCFCRTGCGNHNKRPPSATRSSTNDDAQQQQTLYDLLNASPTDTQQKLRQKYRELARQTHPDAGGDATEFTKISAAWAVLSVPKERLKYDRSLKAQAFVDDVGGWMDNLAPQIFATAGQVRKVTPDIQDIQNTMQDTMQDVSKGWDQARNEFDKVMTITQLQQKINVLLQNAKDANSKRDALQKEIGNDRRLPILLNNDELTSKQANQILKGFNFLENSVLGRVEVINAINRLVKLEDDFKNVQTNQNTLESQTTTSERMFQTAKMEEERAQERLLSAQKQLNEAKEIRQEWEATYAAQTQQEEKIAQEYDRIQKYMQRQKEQTRQSLRRSEDLNIRQENAYLMEESKKAAILSNTLMKKAQQLQKKAEELKRQAETP